MFLTSNSEYPIVLSFCVTFFKSILFSPVLPIYFKLSSCYRLHRDLELFGVQLGHFLVFLMCTRAFMFQLNVHSQFLCMTHTSN